MGINAIIPHLAKSMFLEMWSLMKIYFHMLLTLFLQLPHNHLHRLHISLPLCLTSLSPHLLHSQLLLHRYQDLLLYHLVQVLHPPHTNCLLLTPIHRLHLHHHKIFIPSKHDPNPTSSNPSTLQMVLFDILYLKLYLPLPHPQILNPHPSLLLPSMLNGVKP